ncbi:hypothetical protein C1H46_045876 [Malus baccata]|uniref:Uncharacterized protein n=1 Tax=Malus baccata TaxID=106549 RepID=A0A540K2U6_MALBA|nr:hypothetical protein C1H46_045876 [Malus baccata]
MNLICLELKFIFNLQAQEEKATTNPMPADHAPNDDNQYCNLLHIDHNFT